MLGWFLISWLCQVWQGSSVSGRGSRLEMSLLSVSSHVWPPVLYFCFIRTCFWTVFLYIYIFFFFPDWIKESCWTAKKWLDYVLDLLNTSDSQVQAQPLQRNFQNGTDLKKGSSCSNCNSTFFARQQRRAVSIRHPWSEVGVQEKFLYIKMGENSIRKEINQVDSIWPLFNKTFTDGSSR